MKRRSSLLCMFAIMSTMVLLCSFTVRADDFAGSSSGIFENPHGTGGMVTTGAGTNDFRWGDPRAFGAEPSNLVFNGTPFSGNLETTEFTFGTLYYFNGEIAGDTGADAVSLIVTLAFTIPNGVTREFNFRFQLINTLNTADSQASADFVKLNNAFDPNQTFTVNNVEYTLNFTRFGNAGPDGFITTVDQFHVLEGSSASVNMYGKITAHPQPIPDPDTMFFLSVNKDGTGTGTVTSTPSGILCGSLCSNEFSSGALVTLTATAESGSIFGSWQGCDSSGDNQCTVTLNAAKTITATFNLQPCSYSIAPINDHFSSSGGTGGITVTASSIGCTGNWTATSNESWITINSGSSGSENGTVEYAVSTNQSSSARPGTITVANQTFTVFQSGVAQYILSVSKEGTGTGIITSEPPGISCGSDCNHAYNQGNTITLTAIAAEGCTFAGWSGGGCSGTGPCSVTLSADASVSARFSKIIARSVKLSPQVLMAGFDPILLDFATTRIRITALVREGNQRIGSVSITDNIGSFAFAMNLIGSLSNGDLLYGADLSIDRGPGFSLPDLFGSNPGQILIKAVDALGLTHSFPAVVYGNNPDLTPNIDPTGAPLFSQQGCKRLLPQVLMAGLEPTLLDFDDREIKVRAMVREGSRPIQDVSLNMNNSTFRLTMDLVETLANGDRIYEKEIVFQRGAFGDLESDFENLWGGMNNEFMIEVRDDAGQRHSFPDVRRGDYRTINANECWSDQ